MSIECTFERTSAGCSSLIDVIFIHGLTGDAKETWSSSEDSEEFWPDWLCTELEHLSIYTLGYPVSMFEKWGKKEMDIFERAGNTLEHMAAKGIGNRPVAFVTHSLGGLLTKILLRRANESDDSDFKKIAESTRLVIFLATPHAGSNLANVLKVLPRTSKHIALLANETGFLEDLNLHYRNYSAAKPDLSTVVYYEKHATKKVVTVVSRESADPGVVRTQPIALDKDHINICKPKDKDDIVYSGVKRHIKGLLTKATSDKATNDGSFIGTDYSQKPASDRRDLLQKLIDAKREHEYSYANDAQNEFARNLAKNGLFSSAREDHEALLSEVQTRFFTHIYHPLICQGESDEKIRKSLQTNIIDAISEKTLGRTRFSARAIVTALYYLTEQCHISWDYKSEL